VDGKKVEKKDPTYTNESAVNLKVKKDNWELKKHFSNGEFWGKGKFSPVTFTDGKTF